MVKKSILLFLYICYPNSSLAQNNSSLTKMVGSNDLIMEILSYIHPNEWRNIARVSKCFRDLSRAEYLRKYSQFGIEYIHPSQRFQWAFAQEKLLNIYVIKTINQASRALSVGNEEILIYYLNKLMSETKKIMLEKNLEKEKIQKLKDFSQQFLDDHSRSSHVKNNVCEVLIEIESFFFLRRYLALEVFEYCEDRLVDLHDDLIDGPMGVNLIAEDQLYDLFNITFKSNIELRECYNSYRSLINYFSRNNKLFFSNKLYQMLRVKIYKNIKHKFYEVLENFEILKRDGNRLSLSSVQIILQYISTICQQSLKIAICTRSYQEIVEDFISNFAMIKDMDESNIPEELERFLETYTIQRIKYFGQQI